METKDIIENTYNFSDTIITVEVIDYIAKYFQSIIDYYEKLFIEDEQKNEKLKYDFQNYSYKKSYNTGLDITIGSKEYSSIHCNNYNSFKQMINENKAKNLGFFNIELSINYKSGNNNNLIEHNNNFSIKMKPYDIIFKCSSNNSDSEMNNVEEYIINEIFNKIPHVPTIFYSNEV